MKIVREHVVDELIGDVKTNKFKINFFNFNVF